MVTVGRGWVRCLVVAGASRWRGTGSSPWTRLLPASPDSSMRLATWIAVGADSTGQALGGLGAAATADGAGGLHRSDAAELLTSELAVKAIE